MTLQKMLYLRKSRHSFMDHVLFAHTSGSGGLFVLDWK